MSSENSKIERPKPLECILIIKNNNVMHFRATIDSLAMTNMLYTDKPIRFFFLAFIGVM